MFLGKYLMAISGAGNADNLRIQTELKNLN